MLEHVYVVFLVAAMWLTKAAIFDGREPVLTSIMGVVVWVVLAFSSFSVRPSFDPNERLAFEPIAWLAFGAALLLSVVFLVAAIDDLDKDK